MKGSLYLFFLCCFSTAVSAQYITVNDNYTAQQLVEDVLINNPCANVSNISVNGIAINSGNSFGYFTAGTSSFPFNDGVILSTGRVVSAIGPNDSILSEGPTSWLGDADLEQALGVNNSINATVLEFDFLPLANSISFDYIFSSEQYLSSPSSNQCNYTDGFVFLLKEANTSNAYQNLAVVPGTDIPVKVNTVRGSGTVCPAANEQYFGGFNGIEHPTNFNGQTKALKAQATVTPGTLYHMKLVVADQGNNLYDSAIFLGGGSFKVQKDLGADRLLTTGNPLCDGETLTVDATESGTGNTYQWYKNNAIITGANTAQYTIGSPGTYTVQITLNATACISTGEITVDYAAPLNVSPVTIVQCDTDNDGTTTFDLKKADSILNTNNPGLVSIVYYETAVDIDPIDNPQQYTSTAKTVYAFIENAYRCFASVPVDLQISNNAITAPTPQIICDGDELQDGIYQFDLDTEVTPQILNGLPTGLQVAYYENESDALSGTNSLDNPYINQTSTQTIWAVITNGSDCYGTTPVSLKVNTFTAPNFEDQEVFLCDGASILLSVSPGYASYSWDDSENTMTRSITVDTAGEYNVTVTDTNGCPDTKKFIVKPSGIATITAVKIEDLTGGHNTVLVTATGNGDYEYSLDGYNYQDEPLFTAVTSGEYTAYVKDKNLCGIATATLFVLDYPKFFTPNDDSYNDFWRVDYLERYPFSTITIFDRYGKIVYGGTAGNPGWDGKFNGQPLPSTDYWFVITITDRNIIRGHFALKR